MKENIQDKEYNKLISKFFKGTTTLEEEQRIYAFFKTGNVPDELEQYREMFTDFGTLATDCGIINTKNRNSGQQPCRTLRKMWLTVAGMAASIMIIIGSAAIYENMLQRKAEQIYAGSYVIINGQRINDIRQIKPQIEKTLAAAKTIEQHADMGNDIKNAEKELLEQLGTPEERRQMEQLLKE